MITKIKQLRLDIDGVSQLVKLLNPSKKYSMDLAYLPKDIGIDISRWMDIFESRGYAIVDSTGKDKEFINSGFKQIPTINSELEKSYDSLILAKAWLGKVLGELGTDSPYKSGYKTVEDIESPADTSYFMSVLQSNDIKLPFNWTLNGKDMSFYSSYSHIEKVDWLRTEIDKLINKLNEFKVSLVIESAFVNTQLLNIENSFTHLSEARFWLGFELQRIKEESDKQ